MAFVVPIYVIAVAVAFLAPVGMKKLSQVPIDLSKLTPGHIAALTVFATLIASSLSGLFGIVVALVNGRVALRLARQNSKREYTLKALPPDDPPPSKNRKKNESAFTDRANRKGSQAGTQATKRSGDRASDENRCISDRYSRPLPTPSHDC